MFLMIFVHSLLQLAQIALAPARLLTSQNVLHCQAIQPTRMHIKKISIVLVVQLFQRLLDWTTRVCMCTTVLDRVSQ